MKGVKHFLAFSNTGAIDHDATSVNVQVYMTEILSKLTEETDAIEKQLVTEEALDTAIKEVFAEFAATGVKGVSGLCKWVERKLCTPTNSAAVTLQIAGYIDANTGEGKKYLSMAGRNAGHFINPKYVAEVKEKEVADTDTPA